MSEESRELALFAENDGDLYRQRIEPIIKNLALKKIKGIYDPVKALTLWKYAADDAAKRYTKDFDIPQRAGSYGIFTPEMRREAARELADYYAEQVDDFYGAENKHLLPKKYRRKNPLRYSVHTKKWDDCVRDVKRKGGAADPYAVCTASLGYRGSIKAKHRRRNPASILDAIHHGDRVTIIDRFGKKHSGRAVMRGPAGWALNMGGPHGTPGTASEQNIVKISPGKHHDSLAMRRLMGVRKNPANGFLLSVKNTASGQRAYYTGEEPEAFDSNKSRGKIYATAAHAQAAARMLARDKTLKPGWRYAVVVAARANPESAEKLYTDFHGEPPRHIKRRNLPQFSEGLEIGPVAAITYDTLRDGKNIRFEHEFSKRAAPLLIASDNGRTLALTGGRYQFTERGIIDRAK